MTITRFFGAAAVLVVAMASAATAQDAIQAPASQPDAIRGPAVNAQTYPWAVDTSGAAVVTAQVRGANAYAYVGGGYVGGARSDDDFAHFGDRPMTRRTNCGLQSGATYMGPDGRWYPC
jgi:opacity protein-like surface antigen